MAKDALTERISHLDGILPVRYITDAIKALIKHQNHNTSQHDLVEDIMIQTELAMAKCTSESLAVDAGLTAEMCWTSAINIDGTELCSILNAAIRADDPCNIVHAAVFAKGIEMRRNMDRSKMNELAQQYPDVKAAADMFPGQKFPQFLPHQDWRVCWRGSGFNEDCIDFFTLGKFYRCPGFLATSCRKTVAMNFVELKSSVVPESPAVLWTILLDGRGAESLAHRCKHASIVSKSHLRSEDEFLFSPYSVFQVVATEWSSTPTEHHSVVLRAAIDNRKHEEDLPLAPWY